MFTTTQIKNLILNGKLEKFYNDRYWRKLSKAIIKEHRYECEYCKKRGKVERAEVVHHVKHLKQFPALAYQRFYIDENGQRHKQLVPLCRACHEYEHNRTVKAYKRFTNEERW